MWHGSPYLTADKSLTKKYSLNKKGSDSQCKSLYALVWYLRGKVLNSPILFKKYLVTTNYIDATGRAVILAAAGLPVRALRNENGEEIIDSLERIPNTEKRYVFRFSLMSD